MTFELQLFSNVPQHTTFFNAAWRNDSSLVLTGLGCDSSRLPVAKAGGRCFILRGHKQNVSWDNKEVTYFQSVCFTEELLGKTKTNSKEATLNERQHQGHGIRIRSSAVSQLPFFISYCQRLYYLAIMITNCIYLRSYILPVFRFLFFEPRHHWSSRTWLTI